MIYPARDLTALAGKKIVSITFYSPRIYYSGGKYNVSVGLTDQSIYDEFKTRITGLTQVATDLVAEATTGETELKINFSEPFTYEAGKNLVIDFEVTETGSNGGERTTFYGSSMGNYVAYNSYTSGNTYNGTRQDFLPKVTFAYEDNGPDYITGDVNLSGEVDIDDVNIVIAIILGKDQAENYDRRAYITDDDNIDVDDVDALIRIILGK